MNWITLLSQAYDKFSEKYSSIDEIKLALMKKDRPLMPLYHKDQLAQIEVTLNDKSEVINITTLEKDDQVTIIPCTIESSNKSSGIVAHPLTDNLEYLAGDFTNKLSIKDKDKCFKKNKKENIEIEEENDIFNQDINEDEIEAEEEFIDIHSNEDKSENLNEKLDENVENSEVNVEKLVEKSIQGNELLHTSIKQNDLINTSEGLIINDKKSMFELKNEVYLKQLKQWSESEFATSKLKTIFNYLNKKCLIQDLIDFNIIALDGEKIVLDYDNKSNEQKFRLYDLVETYIGKACVRFRVNNDDDIKECYLDKDLFQSWRNYYESILIAKSTICYATGEEQPIPKMHDKYILSTGSGAKLFSGNDNAGFTYRGRFNLAQEASVVGQITSAKVHNALKWLISRQAFKRNNFCFLVWSNEVLEVTNLLEDIKLDFDFDNDLKKINSDTGDVYAVKIDNFLKGYSNEDNSDNNVIMLGLNATTSGRLSVIYFNYMKAKDYIERLKKWYETMQWCYIEILPKGKAGKPYKIIRTPVPSEIAHTIYGENKELKDNVLNKFYEKINYCILNDKQIPYEFVQSAINRICMKFNFKDYNGKFNEILWFKSLSTTCALIKRYYEKENYSMELEKDRTNRSYVYGRLLAVADVAESRALFKKENHRITMATRIFNNFAHSPTTTWTYIRENLNIYLNALDDKGYFYKNLINEITNLLTAEDFMKNEPLSPEYLIGYSHQMMSLKNYKKEGDKENDDTNE